MNPKIQQILEDINNLHPALEKPDFYKKLISLFGQDVEKAIRTENINSNELVYEKKMEKY